MIEIPFLQSVLTYGSVQVKKAKINIFSFCFLNFISYIKIFLFAKCIPINEWTLLSWS